MTGFRSAARKLGLRFSRKSPSGEIAGAAGSSDQGESVDRLSDEEFLDFVYRKLLARGPDPVGKAHQLEFLRAGNSRAALILNFLDAPEYARKVVGTSILSYIQALPIMDERPDKYGIVESLSGNGQVRVFRASDGADFDWLERKVLENGYYERPGVWSFEIDEDKRLMAAMASIFKPARVLDFGCANGAVLKCLRDFGIAADGVEISGLALSKAPPEVLSSIRCGDLLGLDLRPGYDLLMGLDIFEHLNPNKIEAYAARLASLVRDGGFLLANIPAYGTDAVFGEIFPMDLPGWAKDAAAGRPFRSVPVDDYGYPKNGHLIGADTDWWVGLFGRYGFRREPAIERSLHRAFDARLEAISIARKSFYVFSRKAPDAAIRAVLDRVSG